MLWLIAAIGSSIVGGHNAELNRKYRMDGFRLNFWRSLIMACIWVPFLLIVPWPTTPFFYGAALFNGLALFTGFTVTSNLASQHNGRVAILHVPIKALLVFALWLAVSPHAREHFFAHYHSALLAFAAGVIMVLALNRMRRSDVSLDVLKQLAPIVVMYGIGEVFTRLEMPTESLLERMPLFFCLSYATVCVLTLASYHRRPHPAEPFYTPKLLKVSSYSAIGGIMNHTLYLIALVSAPNPAYVGLISLLTPVWLMVYHKIKGVPDKADPWAGLVLILGAMLLAVATL